MTDMEILREIRQIEGAMPKLKEEFKLASKAYKEACKPLKPTRDEMKRANAAVKAANARLAELLAMEGGE